MNKELQKDAEEYADKIVGKSHRKFAGWITCRDNYLAGRRKTLAELKEAFEAGRQTEETYQIAGGYSFNHHRHQKYKTFDDWYKTRGEKL